MSRDWRTTFSHVVSRCDRLTRHVEPGRACAVGGGPETDVRSGDHEVREDGTNVVFGFHAVKNNTQIMMLPMSARIRVAMTIQSCRRSTKARRVFRRSTLRPLGRIRLLPASGCIARCQPFHPARGGLFASRTAHAIARRAFRGCSLEKTLDDSAGADAIPVARPERHRHRVPRPVDQKARR